jgi:release factor glutamine methyltransferase
VRIDEVTDNYFKDNKKELEFSYPGISLKRIKVELYQQLKTQYLDANEFFNSPYVATENDPIKVFFLALSKGTPLEYISGKKFFYESYFSVSSDVLIPRNETEILVEKTIEELNIWNTKIDETLTLCDIGTGSGCIALSVLRGFGKKLKVLATDISEEALSIANQNNFKLRFSYPASSLCEFKCMDRLTGNSQQFHVITSNPPYIKENNDKELVHQQVMSFEPHLALFLKDSEYNDWFKQLFTDVYAALYDQGVFLMEGHEHHLEELEQIAKELNWNETKILKDYCDRNRFLILRK